MPQWDYSGNGIYFITLVTQNRECNLGQIIKTQSQPPYIELSDFGTIVNNEDFGLDIPKYNRYNHFFQPNYYDHIIRNYMDHQRIKDYIINNPVNWCDDKLNPPIKLM